MAKLKLYAILSNEDKIIEIVAKKNRKDAYTAIPQTWRVVRLPKNPKNRGSIDFSKKKKEVSY